ncbi:MAG: serine hydrolase [Rubrivivax sp.]|nr:serine hydrolase [Rubrivivax sp.]
MTQRSPRIRQPVLAGLAAAVVLAGCDTLPLWMVAQGRSQITDHRHFDNAPIAAAAIPRAWSRAPQPLRWPRGESTEVMEQRAAADGTVALLVAQRGQIVYERYFNGYDAGSIATSFSMAKSVVSLLLGIAIDEGRIAGVDEPVTRFLPELLANEPRFARITLRHLLSMRSGIAFDEGYGSPFTEAARFYLTPDLKREVAKLRIEGEPDRAYAYKSGDTQLLGMALERAVGMPLAAYAQSRLWQPLGAAYDASWSLDSRAGGVVRAFCCLNARAEDYLRIGQLVLQHGLWDGRRIVSAAWLDRSTAAQQDLPGSGDAARRNIERAGQPQQAFYAWQWRRRPVAGAQPAQPGAAVYAQGLYAQIMLVDPVSQTVALRLGQRNGERHWPTWLDELARLNPPR